MISVMSLIVISTELQMCSLTGLSHIPLRGHCPHDFRCLRFALSFDTLARGFQAGMFSLGIGKTLLFRGLGARVFPSISWWSGCLWL
jgi:hypothetical protein